MNDTLITYGPLGIAVLALAWYVIHKEKREDIREEKWMKMIEKLFSESREDKKSTDNVISRTGDILTGMKTLFEVHIRKEDK